jgi:regulator of protease activity HflC (stomatin/prohibitin superfamily)
VLPAPAQRCVDGIESLRVQLTDLELPEERRDVVAHVSAVERQGVRRPVEVLKVALEQLIHSGARGLRLAATSLTRRSRAARAFPLGLRSRRDDLDEIVAALGDRVHAGVDAHAEGTARELANTAPLAH